MNTKNTPTTAEKIRAIGQGPQAKREAEKFAKLDRKVQTDAQRIAVELYDGTRTVAAAWKEGTAQAIANALAAAVEADPLERERGAAVTAAKEAAAKKAAPKKAKAPKAAPEAREAKGDKPYAGRPVAGYVVRYPKVGIDLLMRTPDNEVPGAAPWLARCNDHGETLGAVTRAERLAAGKTVADWCTAHAAN